MELCRILFIKSISCLNTGVFPIFSDCSVVGSVSALFQLGQSINLLVKKAGICYLSVKEPFYGKIEFDAFVRMVATSLFYFMSFRMFETVSATSLDVGRLSDSRHQHARISSAIGFGVSGRIGSPGSCFFFVRFIIIT